MSGEYSLKSRSVFEHEHNPASLGYVKLGSGLRLQSGVLRAPRLGRSGFRMSETAWAKSSKAVGWIERALLDAPPGSDAPSDVTDLIEALLRRRVGGQFWAAPPSWPAKVRIAVEAESLRQLEARVSYALHLGAADEIAVLLPNCSWAPLARASLIRRGICCLIGPVDPWGILDQVDSVVVAGDKDLGLLALLTGRTVHCRSSGYLAGWGLTLDDASIVQRGRREVWQIATAAFFTGVRYRDPYSGRVADIEMILEQLTTWRRIVDEDRGLSCFAGIAHWKRSQLRRFLAPPARRTPVFRRAEHCIAEARASGGAIAVWPSRAPANLESLAQSSGIRLWQVEDGFVRSVGLGSDLLPPCSIVIDRTGIYYDPRRPSDLERILAETEFSSHLQQRARGLIDVLVARRLTKYNTGGGGYVRPAVGRVVLVPGQVEDDRSWRLGGGDCQGNLDLLRRVRSHEPDSFIIYKPHPDVEAGNRVGSVADGEARLYADQIVRDVATASLLESVDAVHVLTSLTGFEALLRGREVFTHGQPFYSGWGLTYDLDPPPRRGRQLTLPELVAGTMILYPRYIDPVTRLPCTPEVLIDRLASRRQETMPVTLLIRALRRCLEGIFGLTAAASHLRARLDHV